MDDVLLLRRLNKSQHFGAHGTARGGESEDCGEGVDRGDFAFL